ncbi:MAG: nucleolar RNA-binding Nop10p family protein [Candidatus Odinarchaeota archaeon]
MPKLLLKCSKCGHYAISQDKEQKCECGGSFKSPYPPRYSPFSKYATYTRKLKQQQFEEEKSRERPA